MKRIIALLLTLALCLSLAACASEEDKAFEEANALLEAGEYEAAIEAFRAVGRYEEISAKIAEAEKALDEANAGFLYGKWLNLNHDLTMELTEGGSGTMHTGETLQVAYTYENGIVFLSQPVVAELKVTEIDGITHLVCEGYDLDMVSEADYAVVGPYEVEITMDNWQEYFDLRMACDIYENDFGDIDFREFGYGLFLKDAYLDKYADSDFEAGVDFELTFDVKYYVVQNALTPEYEITTQQYPWSDINDDGVTNTGSVINYRNDVYTSEYSELYNQIAAFIHTGRGMMMIDDVPYYPIMENMEVTRVQGTLKLFP